MMPFEEALRLQMKETENALSSLTFKLDAFEGPLDLLLHLIDKNKVNIYDIPIVEITSQYMEYISHMETRDMDIMSDFLMMAATLLRIKSQMLLPVQKSEDDEEPVDPRQELVERLLEYKMYKYISEELKDKQMDASRLLFKESTLPPEIRDLKEEINISELLSDVTLSKLHSVFQSIVKKKNDRIDPIRSKFGKIEKEEINLYETILNLQTYGLRNKRFSFRTYMERQRTKMEMIVCFLGILELIKMGRITVSQAELFDDIEINYLANDILNVEEFMSV